MTDRTNNALDECTFELPADYEVANAAPNREIDLVKLALRHRWLLVLGGVAGLMLGYGAYVVQGPAYQAKAQVLVSKQQSVLSNRDETDTNGAGERGEHVALIMSPMIVGRAVEEHKLAQRPSMAGSKDVVQDILDDLKVKRSAGQDQSLLNVLDITYVNRDRNDVRDIVVAVIDAYEDYLSESQQEFSSDIIKLTTQANEDLSSQLQEKQAEYLAFRDSTPLHWKNAPGAETNAADVTNVHQQSLEAIQAELDANALEVAKIKSKINSLQEAIDSGESRESLEALVRIFLSTSGTRTATPVLSSQTASDGLAAQWLPLLLEEQRLLRDFAEDHPDVQNVRRGLQTIRDFYNQQGVILPESVGDTNSGRRPSARRADVLAMYMFTLKAQRNELELRRAELERMSANENKLAKEFAHYLAVDQNYNDELRAIKDVYAVMVGRLKEFKLNQNNRGYALKQIAPVRDELVVKRQLKFCGGGLLFGLGLALILTYVKELQATTLESPDEVRHDLSLPMLAGVPRFDVAYSNAEGSTQLESALCCFHRPGSAAAEAFRSVRTALFAQTNQKQRHVIQVTSPESGDGKTTLASNLAIAIAQTGKQVLLVDADLRSPTIHQLFGISCDAGITDVLSGDLDFLTATRETTVDGLRLLTSGAASENPADTLASPAFVSLLKQAGNEFDYVIVDTPSLLAVSDPCIVAAHSDGVLLVLAGAKRNQAAARRAAELLQTHSANVVGIVVNSLEGAIESDNGTQRADHHRPRQAEAANRRRETVGGSA